MARSKILNDAMDKLLASVDDEIVCMQAMENAVLTLENAVLTMMHEFDGRFMPFRTKEVPVIIAALGLLENSLRGQFPELAKIADVIMEGFSVVGAVRKVGGESDGR